MTLAIEVITDPTKIATLVPAWDALALRDPRSSPYDSGSLAIGLGGIVDPVVTTYVVTARRPDGELAGVLPLQRVPLNTRLGGHQLVGYTRWHTSYFDAVVDPGIPDVANAMLAALARRRDWEHCDLQFVRPDGNLYLATTEFARSEVAGSQLIHIDRTAGAPDVCVTAHKTARRLAKAGTVEFTSAVTAEALDETLQWFAARHTDRWRDCGDSAEFSDPAAVQRLIDVMSEACRWGHGLVGTLRVSGELVAVHLAFRWRETQYSWRMAHDANWQHLSPGRLLFSLMIEDAFAAGCSSYDLGRGSEDYKHLWETTMRPLYRVTFAGQSWRARLATLRRRG
ncbi:MAG: GNAT family N-acetyltransferase [Gemmatimonadales bacterium]